MTVLSGTSRPRARVFRLPRQKPMSCPGPFRFNFLGCDPDRLLIELENMTPAEFELAPNTQRTAWPNTTFSKNFRGRLNRLGFGGGSDLPRGDSVIRILMLAVGWAKPSSGVYVLGPLDRLSAC